MTKAAAKKANPLAGWLDRLKPGGRKATAKAGPVDAARARFEALALLWGADRLRPCPEATDAGLALAVNVGPDDRLIQIPAGLGASARIISERTGAWVDGYETRDDVLSAINRSATPKLEGHRFDVSGPSFVRTGYGGAIGYDLATMGDDPAKLLGAVHESLKPGAILATHEIVARWSNHSALAPCRTTPWGPRRFATEDEVAGLLSDAGFDLCASEDATASLIDAIEAGFGRLRSAAPDLLDAARSDPFARAKLSEVAASVACWMPAATLLMDGKLFARRFVARRPA